MVSESMFQELKECFMEAYDDNKDGKIEIREVRIKLSMLILYIVIYLVEYVL